jgi:hypothetical protein
MNGKTVSFTRDELIMLSDGILSMMENTNKALALIKSSEAHNILEKELEKYRQLNNKVCGMMGEEGEY